MGHTGSAWLVGNKNTSTLPVSIRYEKRGGRGDDYLTWLQSDPRWADKKLGSSGETMKTAGCAVTTVAKLTVYSQSITDSSYNPGYLCDYLNSNGGLDGNGCINWGAAPGLKHEGRGDFNNPSKDEVIKRIGELMSSGYYVALCVDNGGHYVAVIKVTNDGIVMSDPAQNSTTNLFDKYSAQSCDSYHYFSGAKSPQDIGNSTGAKASTDTMSRIASIFGKYGSAIFKSAYTGDWNINWDDVFAEDASTDASVATGVPGDDVTLSGSDNAEKIRNYLRGNLGFTEAGAAGVMGNWMVESGLEPGNLENTFESGGSNAISPGYTDESYVAAIDSKKYTKTQFMSDANHVPSYVANCGSPVGAGFGLGQWTTGQRKGELYDATVGKGLSIASLSGQLNYAMKELMSGTEKYNALLSTLRSTDSYNVAAEEFLAKFEGCPGHSSLPRRQANAKDFYNRFNGKTVQGGKGEGPKNDEEQPKPIGTGCPKPKKGTKEAIEFKKRGGKGTGPTINTSKYSLRPIDIDLNDNGQALAPIQATPSAAMTEQQRRVTQNPTSAYSNESMERLMKEIIGILGVISNNSGNLSLLEDIRSGLSGNTNNIVSNTNNTTVNANGKTKTRQTSQTSTRMSRDEEAARRIAFGN